MSDENQCDGCRQGLRLVDGLHYNGSGRPWISCTADRYGSPVPSETGARREEGLSEEEKHRVMQLEHTEWGAKLWRIGVALGGIERPQDDYLSRIAELRAAETERDAALHRARVAKEDAQNAKQGSLQNLNLLYKVEDQLAATRKQVETLERERARLRESLVTLLHRVERDLQWHPDQPYKHLVEAAIAGARQSLAASPPFSQPTEPAAE
jgi:hypothetical protein